MYAGFSPILMTAEKSARYCYKLCCSLTLNNEF